MHEWLYVERSACADTGGGWPDENTHLSRLLPGRPACRRRVREAMWAVLERRVVTALALVRPPGHHALPDRAMGFSLTMWRSPRANPVQWGGRRVLIVDFDVHHGNGTADIFAADPRVFIPRTSTRSFRGAACRRTWVGAPGAALRPMCPCRRASGTGRVARVPGVLLPLARLPAGLIVSAGFDAHWADPLAQMQ